MVALLGCASQLLCQVTSHCALSTLVSIRAALLWSCRNIRLLPCASPTSSCQSRRELIWCGKVDCKAVAVKNSLPLCCCPVSLYPTWLASVWKATVVQDQAIFASLCTGCHSRISYSLLLHLLPDICTLYKEKDVHSHRTPETFWWLSGSINYVYGNVSFKGFPDPSVLPKWQAEAAPLYISGQV